MSAEPFGCTQPLGFRALRETKNIAKPCHGFLLVVGRGSGNTAGLLVQAVESLDSVPARVNVGILVLAPESVCVPVSLPVGAAYPMCHNEFSHPAAHNLVHKEATLWARVATIHRTAVKTTTVNSDFCLSETALREDRGRGAFVCSSARVLMPHGFAWWTLKVWCMLAHTKSIGTQYRQGILSLSRLMWRSAGAVL